MPWTGVAQSAVLRELQTAMVRCPGRARHIENPMSLCGRYTREPSICPRNPEVLFHIIPIGRVEHTKHRESISVKRKIRVILTASSGPVLIRPQRAPGLMGRSHSGTRYMSRRFARSNRWELRHWLYLGPRIVGRAGATCRPAPAEDAYKEKRPDYPRSYPE